MGPIRSSSCPVPPRAGRQRSTGGTARSDGHDCDRRRGGDRHPLPTFPDSGRPAEAPHPHLLRAGARNARTAERVPPRPTVSSCSSSSARSWRGRDPPTPTGTPPVDGCLRFTSVASSSDGRSTGQPRRRHGLKGGHDRTSGLRRRRGRTPTPAPGAREPGAAPPAGRTSPVSAALAGRPRGPGRCWVTAVAVLSLRVDRCSRSAPAQQPSTDPGRYIGVASPQSDRPGGSRRCRRCPR